MNHYIKKGATSKSIAIFIPDLMSDSGGGLTGLVYNSSGLSAYYSREKEAATAITLATLAAATSAYSSGGFKEIDGTNMPGWYRLDIPDAALARSLTADFVGIQLKGAANMPPVNVQVTLTDDLKPFTFTAASGASGSVTLPAGGSAVDEFYTNMIVVITGGTGAGQARVISAYNGTTKVATVTPNWDNNPDSTSVLVIITQ